ncbi:hypothetical protein SESBI_01676 [Sesbania bispinosa]|nr:hypothetical protein SESBI_01676 [Sesbania bispinosa]
MTLFPFVNREFSFVSESLFFSATGSLRPPRAASSCPSTGELKALGCPLHALGGCRFSGGSRGILLNFFESTMITRARAKALVAEARRNCFVVTEEPEDPSIPSHREARSEEHGIMSCQSVITEGRKLTRESLEEIASKNQQLMADRLEKRNAAAAKKTKNAGEASGKDSQNVEEPKAKCPRVDAIPEKKCSPLKIKASSSTTASPGDKGKGKKVIGASLPTSDMTKEEVQHHLAMQGHHVFGQKSEEEMTEYLNAMSDWCMGGALLAQYFVGSVRDLAAFPKLKKGFHEVTSKLQVDKLKIQTALGQVKLLTDERNKLSTTITDLNLQNQTLTEEKKKALDDVKTATDEAKATTPRWSFFGKLWEEFAGVYFHAAIKQMKFLNPGVELKTRGMSTLCLVENGKWYRAQPDDNVECEPGDKEPASPVIEAEEEGVPNEKCAADEEKVLPDKNAADGEKVPPRLKVNEGPVCRLSFVFPFLLL